MSGQSVSTIKKSALALALALGVAVPVHATSVIGSTEPTQIANNIELIAQYQKQIEQVIYQVKQYEAQLKALRQMDPRKLEGMLKGVGGTRSGEGVLEALERVQEIDGRLQSLSENMDVIYREGRISSEVLALMRERGVDISMSDYVGMMKALARERQATYGKRLDALNEAAQSAKSDIERVNKIAATSKDIATNVEGLAAIVQTNAIMSAQLSGLRQTLTSTGAMEIQQAKFLAAETADRKQDEKRTEMWVQNNMLPVGSVE